MLVFRLLQGALCEALASVTSSAGLLYLHGQELGQAGSAPAAPGRLETAGGADLFAKAGAAVADCADGIVQARAGPGMRGGGAAPQSPARRSQQQSLWQHSL